MTATPKPEGKEYPPRMSIEMGVDGLLCPRISSYVFKPFPAGVHDYISVAEADALVKEAVAKAWEESLDAVKFACRSQHNAIEYLEIIAKGKIIAAYLGGEEYFGCLTGDCPHTTQRQCDDAIEHELSELKKASGK